MTGIKAGQIWREFGATRYVRVRHVCVGGKTIAIETVMLDGKKWVNWRFGKRIGRRSEAAATRFNGKTGGYQFVEAERAAGSGAGSGAG